MIRISGDVANWRSNLNWLLDRIDSPLTDIAAAVGITTTGLYYLRTGKKLPQLDTAASLARVLGVSLGDMVALPSVFRSRVSDIVPPARKSPKKPQKRERQTAQIAEVESETMARHNEWKANWSANVNWLLEHSEVQIQDVAKEIGVTPAALFLNRRNRAEPRMTLVLDIARLSRMPVEDFVLAPAEFKQRAKARATYLGISLRSLVMLQRLQMKEVTT